MTFRVPHDIARTAAYAGHELRVVDPDCDSLQRPDGTVTWGTWCRVCLAVVGTPHRLDCKLADSVKEALRLGVVDIDINADGDLVTFDPY